MDIHERSKINRIRLLSQQAYTIGEAAELCKVSQQTIIRCFDNGKLTGFRVPDSGIRRIPKDGLVRFMRENNITIPEEPFKSKSEILEIIKPLSLYGNREAHSRIEIEALSLALKEKTIFKYTVIKNRKTSDKATPFPTTLYIDGSIQLIEFEPPEIRTYFFNSRHDKVYLHTK
jgi:excisionase family DNA binding protein